MARKEQSFNSQLWFCNFLTYQVTCGVMLYDSRCSHQGTLHSSDQHIPVIRHQTNIKPHEHSYSLLRHSLMISYFMSADSISHLALPLVVVSEADGCWLPLLPVWLLALDCSWCVVAVRVTSLRVSSGSASRWPDAREAMSAPACSACTSVASVARVATLYFPCCNTLCQPKPANTQVRRRNQEKLRFQSTLQRDEEYIEKEPTIPLKKKGQVKVLNAL